MKPTAERLDELCQFPKGTRERRHTVTGDKVKGVDVRALMAHAHLRMLTTTLCYAGETGPACELWIYRGKPRADIRDPE
jgi:hypothetical protein